MTTFTLSLKRLIEITGGECETVPMSFKGVPMGGIQKLTGGNIGVGFMPIFDEDYRDILTGKIVDQFWNREIGQETPDMFQMRMRVKLNEIMPYYNKLYLSEAIPYSALDTIRLQTDSKTTASETGESTGTSSSETLTNSDGRAVSSTTPQTMLSGDEDYASGASDSTSATSSDADASQVGTSHTLGESEGDTLVSGYQGAASDLVVRFRDSLLNIDLMVLRDLDELFMQVFDNGDTYTEGSYRW